ENGSCMAQARYRQPQRTASAWVKIVDANANEGVCQSPPQPAKGHQWGVAGLQKIALDVEPCVQCFTDPRWEGHTKELSRQAEQCHYRTFESFICRSTTDRVPIDGSSAMLREQHKLMQPAQRNRRHAIVRIVH